jgi:chemotaxis regulatin CheY-phosphate phosphatase CheZ
LEPSTVFASVRLHIGDAMDDLNYLFHRQQQERVRAIDAACDDARRAHQQLAEFYEKRISDLTEGRINIANIRSR